MRRLFALLVLVLLPLQWSEAAVARYCGHEKAPEAQHHLGHHESATSVDTTASGPDGDSENRSGHCEMCHLSFMKLAIPYDATSLPVPMRAERFAAPHTPIHPTIPDNPFRPPQTARP